MDRAIGHLWTPLAATPLLWLVVTIAAYAVGRLAHRACRSSPFASPVLIAILLVAAVVLATGTSYQTYFAGAQFINFLLGPATIALAIPLVRNLGYVRRNQHGIGLALLAGSATSIVSGVAIVGQQTFHRLRIYDWRAHGLAAGVAGSGVAAAQSASRDELGAAFAALGIGLNGLLTALLVPLLASLWS